MTGTPIYRVWLNMIQRCSNPNRIDYKNYGGRGITVCRRWRKSFENFYIDMGEIPNPELTIERVDNDGNYDFGNCRWATRIEQARNQGLNKNNRTGIKGVYWNKRVQKYHVQIMIKYKNHHIGLFRTLEEAKRARQEAEQKYWSEEVEEDI